MRKLSLLFFVVTAFSISAFAQSAIDDVAAQASLVTEMDVNGIKVLLKRRPNSATVAGGLFIKGGARNITEKNAGIERLMLSTAIEASKKLPRETVRRELSTTGSGISTSTSPDYSVVGIATTKPDFDRVFDIFAQVMTDPLFAEEDIKRNKDQILTGLRESSAVPEGALETLQDRIIYAGHPYANDVNGNATTINALTAADLQAFHKSMMETSRLLFVFVGDIDPTQLKNKISAAFGKLPKGSYTNAAFPALDFSKGTFDSTQRSVPTNYVKGVFAAPSLDNPDYYAMKVAMALLQTLVYQEVRGRLQLSYAPDADMASFAANTANISVSTTDPNRAVGAMLAQMRLLKERTLNDEIIEEISSFFLTRHYMGQETSAAQVGELAKYELVGGGWRKSFEFLRGVRNVKASDINAVSNKYMKNLRFVYVGDATSINRSVFVPASE